MNVRLDESKPNLNSAKNQNKCFTTTLENIDEMNWDDYSDEEEEEQTIKQENIKLIVDPDRRQTSYYRKQDDYRSNDLKRTNSASTKCTTSSFGHNKQ